jgi:hypothetical protein
VEDTQQIGKWEENTIKNKEGTNEIEESLDFSWRGREEHSIGG